MHKLHLIIIFYLGLFFYYSWCPYQLIAQHETVETTSNKNEQLKKKKIIISSAFLTGSYVGGVYYLAKVWYRDYEREPFHFYNDNAGWNQMDKAAHAYIAYQQSSAGYHLLKGAGMHKLQALWFGGTLGFVFQLPIEILDGLYEGYGFSWGDVYANTAGTVLFMTQQHFWEEQIIKMKFSFFPSPYSKIRPRVLGENPLENLFLDYNAQTYWLSFNLNKIWKADYIPSWLNVAVGYGAGGMLSEFENPEFVAGERIPTINRYRKFLLSPDIDLRRLPIQNKFLKGVLEALNLTKIPAPAVEYNTQNGWIFHFIYF